MDFILGVVVGWAIAYFVVQWILHTALSRARAQIIDLLEQVEQENPTVEANIEEQDGIFLVYHAKDQTFLAQGTSLSEIKQRLDTKFSPQTTVRLVSSSPEIISRLQANDEKIN